MRTGSKITLGTLLGFVNGYLIAVWRSEAINTNDVGRQWIRLIIPGMMIIASVSLILVAWVVDRISRMKREESSNQGVHATR
jgi:hypothetical protein